MLRRICPLFVACLLVAFGSEAVHAQKEPSREEGMKLAHRLANENLEFIVHFTKHGEQAGGIYVFYNNPDPLCYRYFIPGNGWVRSPEGGATWLSADRQQFIGVAFHPARILEHYKGGTPVERVADFFRRDNEKRVRHPLSGGHLEPFDSAVQGTWKWTAEPVQITQKGRREEILFPTRFILDFIPDAFAEITINGTGDRDALARQILETLKTTKDPKCYFQDLDELLKAMAENVN